MLSAFLELPGADVHIGIYRSPEGLTTPGIIFAFGVDEINREDGLDINEQALIVTCARRDLGDLAIGGEIEITSDGLRHGDVYEIDGPVTSSAEDQEFKRALCVRI